MAEKLPFFTLFESFQAPRQLRLLLHDAYVTGAVLDREARTIEVQATSGEAVPDAAVKSLEHMLAEQYDLRRVFAEDFQSLRIAGQLRQRAFYTVRFGVRLGRHIDEFIFSGIQ